MRTSALGIIGPSQTNARIIRVGFAATFLKYAGPSFSRHAGLTNLLASFLPCGCGFHIGLVAIGDGVNNWIESGNSILFRPLNAALLSRCSFRCVRMSGFRLADFCDT